MHVYKGSAEFIWNNFDEVFIAELLNQTSIINKAEQDFINGENSNKTTHKNFNPKEDYKISCNNLEDIEPTEEELRRFKEKLLRKGIVYEECLT